MTTYTATIRWTARPGEAFAKGRYSRAHISVMPDLIRHPPCSSSDKEGRSRLKAGMTGEGG